MEEGGHHGDADEDSEDDNGDADEDNENYKSSGRAWTSTSSSSPEDQPSFWRKPSVRRSSQEQEPSRASAPPPVKVHPELSKRTPIPTISVIYRSALKMVAMMMKMKRLGRTSDKEPSVFFINHTSCLTLTLITCVSYLLPDWWTGGSAPFTDVCLATLGD